MKITVKYCKNGTSINEFNYRTYWEKEAKLLTVFPDAPVSFSVSTELGIDMFRLLVVKGDISPNDIVFDFDGKISKINDLGMLEPFPEKYLRATENVAIELLKVRAKQRGDEIK